MDYDIWVYRVAIARFGIQSDAVRMFRVSGKGITVNFKRAKKIFPPGVI